MEFLLETEAVPFRNQTFKVRELTADERFQWRAAMRRDPTLTVFYPIAAGTLEPSLGDTEEARIACARTMPTQLADLLSGAVMRLTDPESVRVAQLDDLRASAGRFGMLLVEDPEKKAMKSGRMNGSAVESPPPSG